MKKSIILFLCLLTGPLLWGSFLDLDGTSSNYNGPNCWNGAMYAAGVIENKRFMHPNEWHYYLNNHCEEVEHAVPGAVGRIYIGETEVHGFIHLDEDKIFAKHGEAQAHGYKVMSYKKMMAQYGRTRECSSRNYTRPECYHSVKYYLCESKQRFPAVLMKLNRVFEQLSFSKDTKLIYKDSCTSDSFLAREAQLGVLEEILIELSNSKDRNNELEKALYESYSREFFNLDSSNRNYRCKNRKLKYKKLKEVRRLFKDVFATSKNL
jgi:hypothetical protein